MSDLKEEVKSEDLQGENLANSDATTGENKAEEQAKEAPKKPTKEQKTPEDLTKSTWKVINPFMHGEDSKRVKYEVGEKLPKDFSQEELERFVSLGIIGKA